jgi:[ribosomal protein S5]-alanine N-acetyltransferase
MTSFTLRPWLPNDVELLVKNANNVNIAKQMTDAFPSPYNEAHAADFIDMALSYNPIRMFAIDIDGKACGGIGIHPQADIMQKNAELGYWLGESYWGLGIMSRAIPLMVDYAFKTFPIERIYARPFGNNGASQKVLQKSGFVLEAEFEKTIFKNGQFLNEMVFATRR